MNRVEARRLALLIALDEVLRSIDVSDEWMRHPETDDPLTAEEAKQIKREAMAFAFALEKRISRMKATTPTAAASRARR